MGIKACTDNPTAPNPAGPWIIPVCFSMLGVNRFIMLGPGRPANGIDTLPPTPAWHKGSPSPEHVWECGCVTWGAV